MGIPQENAYTDGFIDGQEDVLNDILEIVDEADGRTEAYENIMAFVRRLKKAIESL